MRARSSPQGAGTASCTFAGGQSIASFSAPVAGALPLVCCAPAIVAHPTKLMASVKAISTFIASSLHSGSALHCGKMFPGSSIDPGMARIFLDNGSIPLYTETCQHVESTTQGKAATATRSAQLLPYGGPDVPGGEDIVRPRSESERRLALQRPS